MQAIVPCLARYTPVYVRFALGVSFLAAVTDRCGLWGPPGTRNVAWGNFDNFLAYAAQLNPYLPTAWIPTVGWIVTLAEVACGLALITNGASFLHTIYTLVFYKLNSAIERGTKPDA
jgi:hypothetical protein